MYEFALAVLIQLVEIARFALLGKQVTSPDHESAQLDTVCCIREVVHRVVRPFAFGVELVDLVVPRHRRSTHLDDIHIIARQIQLSERLDELSEEALLRPAKVRALRGGTEIICPSRSSRIDGSIVAPGCPSTTYGSALTIGIKILNCNF